MSQKEFQICACLLLVLRMDIVHLQNTTYRPDPDNPNKPLIEWPPYVKVDPYRDKLKCVFEGASSHISIYSHAWSYSGWRLAQTHYGAGYVRPSYSVPTGISGRGQAAT